MSWKVRVHQQVKGGVQHRTIDTYPEFEALEMAQTVLWWSRYCEPGDSVEILILAEVSPESEPGK